jgi:hypothetical protein
MRKPSEDSTPLGAWPCDCGCAVQQAHQADAPPVFSALGALHAQHMRGTLAGAAAVESAMV